MCSSDGDDIKDISQDLLDCRHGHFFLDVIACLPVSESGGRAIDSFRFEIAIAFTKLSSLLDSIVSQPVSKHRKSAKCPDVTIVQ